MLPVPAVRVAGSLCPRSLPELSTGTTALPLLPSPLLGTVLVFLRLKPFADVLLLLLLVSMLKSVLLLLASMLKSVLLLLLLLSLLLLLLSVTAGSCQLPADERHCAIVALAGHTQVQYSRVRA